MNISDTETGPAGTGPGPGEGDRVLRAARKGGKPLASREERASTGVGGSSLERRAAERLAAELEATGRQVQVQEVRVRAGEGPTVAVHAALAIAASLLGLISPLAGAVLVLLVAFSFYGERGLGMFLLSRILPQRRTRNLLSPPLGPAWEREIDVILAAGYDSPPAYPTGEWLAGRLGGRLTTDRLLFWGGMVPVFAALMLRVTELDGLGTQLLQIAATAVLLTVVAAQADRKLKGETLGVEQDLDAARDLIKAASEIDDPGSGEQVGIGICLFGAETEGAAGAEAFYADRRLKAKPEVTVIGLVTAADERNPEATAREGDLTGVGMNFSLVKDSPLKPKPVTIRRDTAAGRAARRGVRAVTLVGRGETGLDLVFDAIETTTAEGGRK